MDESWVPLEIIKFKMPTNLIEILRKSKSELMKIKINLKSEALHVKLLLMSIKCLMTVNFKK